MPRTKRGLKTLLRTCRADYTAFSRERSPNISDCPRNTREAHADLPPGGAGTGRIADAYFAGARKSSPRVFSAR
ncbi:MAG: hypothetical protein B7Y61_12590, partial [Rhizobiales bacterium 35-66-30]